MRGFFYKFLRNIIKVFSPKNIVWHFIAIILTYIIVTSGFDWSWFLLVRSEKVNYFLFPAVVIGGLIPIIIPLGLLIIAKIRKRKSAWESKKITNMAWAIGQSAMLGWIISSFYKIFTGRIQPDLTNLSNDISSNFQFGFWNHGIFWGWPSSHTTVAFAMAIALLILFPKHKIIKAIAILYALYIGLGVSIGVHWFSEFIAGAIFGAVIGSVVGKSYKEKLLN